MRKVIDGWKGGINIILKYADDNTLIPSSDEQMKFVLAGTEEKLRDRLKKTNIFPIQSNNQR